MAETGEPMGYRELVRRNSDFRWLWCGQIVSLFGDWFNLVASAALVAQLTQSGLAVGGLFVVRTMAPFLTSPIAGIVADRFNRKRILIVADLTRAATVLGFLLVRDVEWIGLLYGLTAIQLGISGFFFTARNAILPDLVPQRAIGAANAISSATWSVMLALGAAAGGLAAGTLGVYPAFLIDSMTFLLSAGFIAKIAIQPAPRRESAGTEMGTVWQDYRDGLDYLRGHVDVLFIATHKAALMLFFGATFQVVQVAIGERVFVIGKSGTLGVGVMFGIIGVGTGIGPLIARRWTADRDGRMRWAITLGYVVGAAGLAVVSSLASFSVVLLGILLVGLGNSQLWVFSTQLLLRTVPGPIRGRIFATDFALFTLASALGAATVGHLLDSSLGLSGVLGAMAALSLVPALLWSAWLLWRGRR